MREKNGYMREIGTMWQIGVLTGKGCTFMVQHGSFSALLGNGRSTVSRVLFGEENSLNFGAHSVSSAKKLGERNSLSSLPGTR